MEGLPAQDMFSRPFANACADPLLKQAWGKASVGEFEAAEGFLWRAAGTLHGFIPTTDDDPPYIRDAANQPVYAPNAGCYVMQGVSCVNPRTSTDPMVMGWVATLEEAKAKWEEGAPARAIEWEKGAPLRRVAEEVARLKAEIARVEQEEVDRQAALAKEALEKQRIKKEEEEEKQRKAEVTSLERDAAALREKLAAMKELMAIKAADPLAYETALRRAPIQGVSISYAVIHFAEKVGISREAAEAVLAVLKPTDGHRTNALLAEQTFVRFAKSKGITVTGAIATMREWAEGRN